MSCDFHALATPGVQGLSPYQPGKPVEELERELGLTGVVKLASNENPLGPGERARAAITASLSELGRYPDGSGHALRHRLAAHHGVSPEWITLGNGSNDVLELVARAFVSDDAEVVFSEHAFAVYPLVTQALGARAVVVPAVSHGHDPEAMAAAVGPDTRLVFVANPNNPTGTWIEERPLARLVERIPPEVVIVIDEAYVDYVDAPAYPRCIPWIERYPNLMVTRTFSKAHGLAGLRVGYAVSQTDVADLMNRVRQPFNVNSVALAAATAAIDDDAHLERSRELNRAGLAQLQAGLQALGLEHIPSVANFVTVDVGRDAGPVYDALLREGVIVRPVGGYGLPRHLRITVGLEVENRRCLEALQRVLDGAGDGLA